MESCKNFSEMIHCTNNLTDVKCEEMKASLISYCSSKECDGKKFNSKDNQLQLRNLLSVSLIDNK